MQDANEVSKLVQDILTREQKNAQTLNVLSAKVADQTIAEQLRELAAQEQRSVDQLAEVNARITNASTYAGTGFLNSIMPDENTSTVAPLADADYPAVLIESDGTDRAE